MLKIALVGPELEENLSLRYLASSLAAAGFESEIVPFDGADELPRVLSMLLDAGDPPALVGLSLSFQLRAKDFLALAVALRRRGYAGHITAGGHFGTFACKEILRDFPEIDSICRHEAEETLVTLAAAICAGSDLRQVPGITCRDAEGKILSTDLHAPPDLQKLPWPDRRGLPAQCLGHAVAPLVASRGCYANCSFCCISAWHEQTLPGKRFRLRPIEDVAREMAWLHRQKKIEVFVFHDDNFFLPDRAQALMRVGALADALDRHGVRNFAVIVKARPNDLDDEILEILSNRLGLLRLYLGVESDSTRGLRILGRRLASAQNHQALQSLERAGIYACFNMLIFDPDTRIDDLETNLAFMEKFAEVPRNFGRVELYAGTPLLALMQAKKLSKGDYLEWNYPMREDVQEVFELAMECFYVRNFSDQSAAHRLMGTRFCVEVAARFHPEVFRESWRAEAKKLNRILTQDSVKAMREIIGFVNSSKRDQDRAEFAGALSRRLRRNEHTIHEAAGTLETEIQDARREIGRPGSESLQPGGNRDEKRRENTRDVSVWG